MIYGSFKLYLISKLGLCIYTNDVMSLAVSLTQLVDRSLKKRITAPKLKEAGPSITNSLVAIAGRITSYHSEQRS